MIYIGLFIYTQLNRAMSETDQKLLQIHSEWTQDILGGHYL